MDSEKKSSGEKEKENLRKYEQTNEEKEKDDEENFKTFSGENLRKFERTKESKDSKDSRNNSEKLKENLKNFVESNEKENAVKRQPSLPKYKNPELGSYHQTPAQGGMKSKKQLENAFNASVQLHTKNGDDETSPYNAEL